MVCQFYGYSELRQLRGWQSIFATAKLAFEVHNAKRLEKVFQNRLIDSLFAS